jgi:epoxide hydrolase-like predicted phosphatase
LTPRKYSVVVFDLGNVLIPFDYSIIINRLNKIESGLGDKFYNLYKENYHVHREFESWKISTDDFIKIMLEWLDHKINREEFCELYSNIFAVNEDVAELLPEIKKKYKLVLLSNTNYIHQKYGWENYDFIKNFDKLVLSHEAGAIKPEEKIYRTVEAFTQLPSEEHIFIDDIEEYVNGAKQIGWDGIQFTGYENLVHELKKRKIL